MSRASDATSIPAIIRNDEGRYEGNLKHYLKVLFFNAQNIRHPYHNLRHMLHVTWLCYQAIVYYGDKLTPRQARNLLIAALFHDFDHSGLFGNDDLNIERAVRALRKHASRRDRDHLDDIEAIVRISEFPHTVPSEKLDLLGKILRDADVSQSFSIAWLQQIVVGLGQEWGKSLLDVLRMQRGFHEKLKYYSEWAQQEFPAAAVAAKIQEAQEYLDILESPDEEEDIAA